MVVIGAFFFVVFSLSIFRAISMGCVLVVFCPRETSETRPCWFNHAPHYVQESARMYVQYTNAYMFCGGLSFFYGALTPLELEYCTRLFNDLLTDGSANAEFFLAKHTVHQTWQFLRAFRELVKVESKQRQFKVLTNSQLLARIRLIKFKKL